MPSEVNISKLIKLQESDVRKIWPREAEDLSRWIKDNINLLNEALGLQIEIEEQEVFADIFNLYREGSEVRCYTQLARILAEKSSVLKRFGAAARDKAEEIIDQMVNKKLSDFPGWLKEEMKKWD